jgi:hypothetical protein
MRKAARRAALAAVIVLLGSSLCLAQARKHAILVGVGHYTYLPTATLEGPPNDIRAMQRVLTESWGFDPRNVTVLQDKDATKTAILSAIDRLAETTKPADFIFLYFSGHGTSGYDRTFKDVGIDGNSGALIPADFKPGPVDRLKEGLIIGSRDLRPRFEKIEKDRKLFVLFDSCFSGNAARLVFAVGQARYVAPTELVGDARALQHTEEEGPPPSGPPEAPEVPYPYANLLYISAASKSEKAMDIDSRALRSGRAQTVDDQPHGALTNAFLLGLSGAADTNRDRKITYGELYQFVRDTVMQQFPHQPQLLAPAMTREELLASPVLATTTRPSGASASGPAKVPAATGKASLRVKTADLPAELARKIGATPGVTLTTGDGAYDLLVTQGPQGFKLYHASGDELAAYQAGQAGEVVERVARQVAVQELIGLDYPDQDFNVTLEIPGNRGFLKQGDQFVIDFAAEKDSHVLLFNVDNGGFVSVLYPFTKAEARPARKGRVPAAPDALRVSPPFGTEYLKVFAFVEKPAGFDRWIEASFSAKGPELDELLKMLRTAKGRKAQARLKVVTRASAR